MEATVEHFFVGVDRPWMFRLVPKPMVSVNSAMARKLDLAKKQMSWADSGAFHLIRTHGYYPHTHEQYRGWLEVMRPTFFTQMDWPCEPDVLASSGLTVREHQRRSLTSADECADFDMEGLWSKFVPTIQGWRVDEYLKAAEDLEAAGLWRPYMAIGSICRRGQERQIKAVIHALREFSPKTRFHGFGVKSRPKILELLWSADSFAWRFNARKKLFAAHGSGFEQRINLVPYLVDAVSKGQRWERRGVVSQIQRTLRRAPGVSRSSS